MIIKSFLGIDNKTYFKEYKKFAVNFEKEICIIKNNLKQHKEYSIKIDIDGRDQFKGYLYCYFFENKRKNINFDNIIFRGNGNDTYHYKLNNKRQKIKRISKLKNRKCFYLGELFCNNDDSFLFKGMCYANELKNEIDKIINLNDNKETNEYNMEYIMCC